MNETPAFPMAPAPFTGDSREVDPGPCFDWLRQGWAMFLVNTGIWIGVTVLLLVILMAISIVPLFGAGMFRVCRRISDNEEPAIADLFAGFHHQAGQLVMVGVFFALGIFGIAFLAFLLVSGGVLGGVVTGKVAGFGIALGGVMLAGLLVMVLSVPIIMATWYAPALVFFHDMKPIDAMKASFAAGARNWLAMCIFGVFLVVALFCAMLPGGMGLVLLLPGGAGAGDASYRDIFMGS